MPTNPIPVPETLEFRDTRREHRIQAQIAALVCAATGNVHRDLPKDLEDVAYDMRRGRRSPVGSYVRFLDMLTSHATLSRSDARRYAEQMLELAHQLMEVRLPCDPEPHQPNQQGGSHLRLHIKTGIPALTGRGVLGADEDYIGRAA